MKFLTVSISVIFGLTLLASLVSYGLTLQSLGLGVDDFCFESSCIEEFESLFSGTINIIKFGSSFAYIFIFSSGVYIALRNYQIGVKSSALSGHISHLSMFKDYMEGEIEKYGLLNIQKINVYNWYTLAFPDSSQGDISVSDKYRGVVDGVAKAIDETNRSISSPMGGFGYRKHQDRMIKALKPLGISLSYRPKNDFVDVETEIFKLIDSFNHTFTDIKLFLENCQRDYV